MNPTHIGKCGNCKRLHLTVANGFSACGRECVDLKLLGGSKVDPDDWCQMCLKREAESAVLHARIAYDQRGRSWPFREADALRVMKALWGRSTRSRR